MSDKCNAPVGVFDSGKSVQLFCKIIVKSVKITDKNVFIY